MAVLGKFKQTSHEKKEKVLDYSQWLGDGETISSISFAITPVGNSTQVQAVVVDHTINVPATSVNIFLSGGDNGSSYKIVITATTSGAQIKQDEIILKVEDL